jgi:hypothetical protein
MYDGWRRLPGPKCGVTWEHLASGWLVRHCGHPTANWPYFLVDPGLTDHTVVSWNGLGFKTLDVAIRVVEGILDEELHVTGKDCELGVLRVEDVTACGQPPNGKLKVR